MLIMETQGNIMTSIQANTDAAMFKFVKDYLDGAVGLFERDPANSDFSRGYQKALASLKSVLDEMEKSTKSG